MADTSPRETAAEDLRRIAQMVEDGEVDGYYLIHLRHDHAPLYSYTALLSKDPAGVLEKLREAAHHLSTLHIDIDLPKKDSDEDPSR